MLLTGLDFDGEKMLKLQLSLGQIILTWPQLYPKQRVDNKCNSGDSHSGKENGEMMRSH